MTSDRDTNPNAGRYMYHRILRPLLGADANLAARDMTVRVADGGHRRRTASTPAP